MISIQQKILDEKKPVILFEIVPPPRSTSIAKTLDVILETKNLLDFDALNIPEIYDSRLTIKKYKAIEIADALRKKADKNIPIIINQPVVYSSWKNQKKQFIKFCNDLNIHTVVLVGGDSHKKKYPGPGVTVAAALIKKMFAHEKVNFLLGGITIPTRENETERILEKTLSGCSFFTSQVLMDEKPVKKLLANYAKICQVKCTIPARIFLSFTPISRRENLDFLNGLRVKIPKKTVNFLMKGWLGVGWRSIELAGKILTDILQFNRRFHIPIGLNIEYIMRENFELAYLMGQDLIKIYKKNYP